MSGVDLGVFNNNTFSLNSSAQNAVLNVYLGGSLFESTSGQVTEYTETTFNTIWGSSENAFSIDYNTDGTFSINANIIGVGSYVGTVTTWSELEDGYSFEGDSVYLNVAANSQGSGIAIWISLTAGTPNPSAYAVICQPS